MVFIALPILFFNVSEGGPSSHREGVTGASRGLPRGSGGLVSGGEGNNRVIGF